jgi:hypothetical protein
MDLLVVVALVDEHFKKFQNLVQTPLIHALARFEAIATFRQDVQHQLDYRMFLF